VIRGAHNLVGLAMRAERKVINKIVDRVFQRRTGLTGPARILIELVAEAGANDVGG
jgi:hypothetical protein